MCAEELQMESKDELLAELERVCMDKSLKRLQQEEGCRIINNKEAIVPGDLVIVSSPKQSSQPFFVAQCLANNFHSKQLDIHWFKPTQLSMERGNIFHKFNFKEEHTQIPLKNRQKGGNLIRLQPNTQTVQYAVVHFAFSKLTPSGGLPPQVQRQLKNKELISSKVKR